MTRLLRGKAAIWPEIVKSKGRNKRAAIAYLGVDAPKLFADWGNGDKIVCDCSESSIKMGSTSPLAIEVLMNMGVRVYRCDNLHAKVVVIGGTAYIGSMNASISSSRKIEACIETTSPKLVSDAKQVINSVIKKESVEVDYSMLKRLKRLPTTTRHGGSICDSTEKYKFRLYIEGVQTGTPINAVSDKIDEFSSRKNTGRSVVGCVYREGNKREREGDYLLHVDLQRNKPSIVYGPAKYMESVRIRKFIVYAWNYLLGEKNIDWSEFESSLVASGFSTKLIEKKITKGDRIFVTSDKTLIDAIFKIWDTSV